MSIAMQLELHVDAILSKTGADKKLAKRIDRFARERGLSLSPDDKPELIRLCREYVRTVVSLLVACDGAATRAGALAFAGPILQTAAGYFLQPFDYIPDRKGTYGLLDDAYLACRFVTRVSKLFEAERGVPLVDTSLDQHSPTVRALIGEPLASRLDADVEATLQQVLVQLRFAQMNPFPLDLAQRRDGVERGRANVDLGRMAAIASGDYLEL